LGAALADVGRRVIAQHDYFLVHLAVAAGFQNAQSAPLFEKQVHDRQVPLLTVRQQPGLAFIFCLRRADCVNTGQLFQRSHEIVTDGGVVFDDISF